MVKDVQKLTKSWVVFCGLMWSVMANCRFEWTCIVFLPVIVLNSFGLVFKNDVKAQVIIKHIYYFIRKSCCLIILQLTQLLTLIKLVQNILIFLPNEKHKTLLKVKSFQLPDS